MKKICEGCGAEFERPKKAWNKKYHSAECYKNTIGSASGKNLKLDSCKVGTISELIVCTDLFRQGYEIFRAVSQSASCDLIALKNKNCLRVEVKTGCKTSIGVSWADKKKTQTDGKHDILAVVVNGNPIYFPELRETGGNSAP